METKNTNVWIGVGVVLLIIIGLWYMKSTPDVMDQQLAGDESIESVEDTSPAGTDIVVPPASLSYTQAMAKYKDVRIQLDKDCRPSRTNETYKNNTSVMIDNRSSEARTIKLGSTFGIKAWGFRIVKLSSSNLPATWYLDCDGSQNVATILIQK